MGGGGGGVEHQPSVPPVFSACACILSCRALECNNVSMPAVVALTFAIVKSSPTVWAGIFL